MKNKEQIAKQRRCEASVPKAKLGDTYAQILDLKLKAILGGTDHELTHHTGGVGVVSPKQGTMQRLQPTTSPLQDIGDNGRYMITTHPLPNGALLAVCNLYGWTNANLGKGVGATSGSLPMARTITIELASQLFSWTDSRQACG